MVALAVGPFLVWARGGKAGAALGATGSLPQDLAQNQSQNPMHLPSPLPPGVRQPPGTWPDSASPFPTAKIDRHAILVDNQKHIRKDVARLYDLAGKLRQQVEQTDSTQVLSLDMIQTTNEIEKLAKQIRDLAKD